MLACSNFDQHIFVIFNTHACSFDPYIFLDYIQCLPALPPQLRFRLVIFQYVCLRRVNHYPNPPGDHIPSIPSTYCTTELHPSADGFLAPVHKNVLAPLPTVTWQVLPPAHMLDVTREPENHKNDDSQKYIDY